MPGGGEAKKVKFKFDLIAFRDFFVHIRTDAWALARFIHCMEAVLFYIFMFSPTVPVFATLPEMSQRAKSRYQHSVSKTLDKSEPVSRKAGEGNSGQYVYATRLQIEVKRSRVYDMNLQSALSHYQTQDGFLGSAIDKYQLISLLTSNPLLTDWERDNLNKEFESFRKDIMSFSLETANENDG